MNKQVSLAEIIPVIEETLNTGGDVKFTVTGNSMLPLLRHQKDSVILEKTTSQLKRYDLPLYRRKDGKFILHRVIRVTSHGYTMCGDNQFNPEYHVTDDQIIGIVTGIIRDDVYISCDDKAYLTYARRRSRTRIFRYSKAVAAHIVHRVSSLWKRND